MKPRTPYRLLLALLFVPGLSHAAPIFEAIELVSKIFVSSATSNAWASADFASQAGDRAGQFAGSAQVYAGVSVSGNADASARASATWTYQFKALKHLRYFVDWSYSEAVNARSSGFADAAANAKVIDVSAFGQQLANDHLEVSADSYVGSDSDADAKALAGSVGFGYLTPGTIFDFTGALYADAIASSGYFSNAGASSNSRLNFTVRAVPEPATVLCTLIALGVLSALRIRQNAN